MLNSATILERLNQKMGQTQYDTMIDQIQKDYATNTDANSVFDKYIYPKMRQYGLKIHFSCRNILVDQNNNIYRFIQDEDSDEPYEEAKERDKALKIKNGTIVEVVVYSMWVSGRVFFFSPTMKSGVTHGTMYGEDVTNREIANEWNKVESHKDVYFVMNTLQEIEELTNKWYNENVKDKKINVTDISHSYMKYMILELRIKDLL